MHLQRDPELLLHTLSTDELIALHNVLSGGSWLRVVRRVLSWRTLNEREKVRKGVGAFSFDAITGIER